MKRLKGKTKSERSRKAGLPFLLVNMVMTADGKITTVNRKVASFSSARDQEHLMELRATADAVMAGARTVDLNPVTLGPGTERFRRERRKRGLAEYNLRVVVSGSGSLDPDAKIFKKKHSPVIVLTSEAAGPRRLAALRAVADEVRTFGEREIDFRRAFSWLRKQWGVKRLLCEGGGELNEPLFRAGLVDELHLTVSPKIFGGRKAPTIVDGKGMGRLSRCVRLKLKSASRHGDEMFFVFARESDS